MEGTEKQMEGSDESTLDGMVWCCSWTLEAFQLLNVFTNISENRLLIRDLKEYKDSFLTISRGLSEAGEGKKKKTLKKPPKM